MIAAGYLFALAPWLAAVTGAITSRITAAARRDGLILGVVGDIGGVVLAAAMLLGAPVAAAGALTIWAANAGLP
jgi:hypothetical protein